MRLLLVLFAALLLAPPAAAQTDLSFLTIRPEATDYAETTRYDEVVAFLDVLDEVSPQMHGTRFGYSVEGRSLPLMVWGDVADASPQAVRASGKLRVFVMANIHAGEVSGKEALLQLLRRLATGAGPEQAWADSLVLLAAPIYNADGNERISLYHRPRQHGPVGGMGQRPNAQGLDLNRDHTKLDSPEARSLVALMNAYDPHVVVDLHTTNGTAHAYHLTYAPPLHPDTPQGITDELRGRWLPTVTDSMEARGFLTSYYGNLPWPGQDHLERGWYTFDWRPRFNNNYVGQRGRFAILSEAYSYLTFPERIEATRAFVEEVLGYAAAHPQELIALTEAADAEAADLPGQPLTLRADFELQEDADSILMGEVATVPHPYTGEPLLLRQDVPPRPERLHVYDRFAATETEQAPTAYLVPPDLRIAHDRIQAHGLLYDVLPTPQSFPLQRFLVDSLKVAAEPYQGHRMVQVQGAYAPAEEQEVPAGTWLVPVDQPLGRVAFGLLEPESGEGLTTWGLLGEALQAGEAYPIARIPYAAE